MNNQPGSNGEGYLAAQKLPVAMIQHCRIEPVLNPALVRMVNQRANAVIAVPDSVHQVLLTHGVAAEKCVTVFNAIDIRQSLPIREAMRQQLLTVQPKTFFGSIGSLIARKSHQHTLQAREKFSLAFPEADWRMVILGEGPQHDVL